jgi:hypothetical protein
MLATAMGELRKPTYVRLYADADGESHFEDVFLPMERYSSPMGTEDARAQPIPTTGLVFRTVLGEAPATSPHTAPEPLLMVLLDGDAEVEVSDGEIRQFGPGSVIVVEDTAGKGHITRSLSDSPRTTLIASLIPARGGA